MMSDDNDGLKLLDICLTDEENPEKTSPRKPVPTGDQTRARCVTDAHAAVWPTAVDLSMATDISKFICVRIVTELKNVSIIF